MVGLPFANELVFQSRILNDFDEIAHYLTAINDN